jgi:hypothetical protein
MPLQATSGAASYDAFGGGVVAEPNYIESCFSTWLYTGTGAAQTITNGIDLSTKGGMVWIKNRTQASDFLAFDTARGIYNRLLTYDGDAQASQTNTLTAFNTNGFSIGNNGSVSNAPDNFASWTFRKQPKFFDIVTWTGDGTGARTITHNLGSVAGCIINKPTSATGDWFVYHRGNPSPAQDYLLRLNTTLAAASGNAWNNYAPTSTDFQVSSARNVDGVTYVAYLFAHDAGGFGLTGTDNVISCGSYTGNGSATGPVVTLGYEPQSVMIKRTDSATNGNWQILDIMRGMSVAGTSNILYANLSGDESPSSTFIIPTATGFQLVNTGTGYNGNGATYIYIAIRRGPMKVPTSGTSVFTPVTYTGNGTAGRSITAGFPVDLAIGLQRTPANGSDRFFVNRLVGATKGLVSWDTFAEATDANSLTAFDSMTSVTVGTDTTDRGFNGSGRSLSPYFFRRAPSFMDIVCYKGTDAGTMTHTHNLGVTPQLIIVKNRSAAVAWAVQHESFTGDNGFLVLNTTAAKSTAASWFSYAEQNTDTTFKTRFNLNTLNENHVAYLFATCAGVSKVGSYTGNGSSQTINCGFTGGARFVLVKATSTTGNWIVADSARGIVAGNDPYLKLNNTNAETTGEDWLDTDSTGFVVNEVSGSNANTNGVTYIFLAIA